MSTNKTPILSIAECLETRKSRTLVFQNLYLILQDKERCEQVTSEETLRILNIFEKCLNSDVQCIPKALNTVLFLLTNAKVVSILPTQDLLPSIFAVLHFLRTQNLSETQNLRTLGVQVFLSYPVEVITSVIIANNCSEAVETVEGFIPNFQEGGSKTLHIFLNGLLKTLSEQNKKQLIQDALPTWFKVIAVIMDAYSTLPGDSGTILEGIESLELLTEAMIDVDYFQCSLWKNEILKYICDPNMYPGIILKQLQKGNTIWHRFWIAFVKLLKNQITRNCPHGTPIHPMLAVVETAFKMDADNRCCAFKCWDVLINNLSNDTNAKSFSRYIKLLLIPLKLNNAKTEATAQAKFYTWWNMILKFQSRMEQFTDEVLVEFLNFMFGAKVNKHFQNKSTSGAAQIYDSLKSLCLQAFAEIVGHDTNCNSSILPKLNQKLLNNKLLASHWDKWMISLKTSILITNSIFQTDNMLEEPMEVLCVWKAFVTSISELPPNGVRKDMFNELIQVLVDMLKICTPLNTVSDIIFCLAMSVSEGNERIREMVYSKGDDQDLQKILSVITSPKMIGVFERYETPKVVEMLKPFTDYLVETSNSKSYLAYLLRDSRSLKLWAALVHSTNEAQIFIDTSTVKQMLLWPVWAMNENVDNCTVMEWQNLYTAYAEKLSDTDINLFQAIKCDVNNLSYFKLIVVLCILKSRLLRTNQDDAGYPEILEIIAAQVKLDYERYNQAIPMLVDTTIVLLDNVSSTTNSGLAMMALKFTRNIVQMFFSEIQSQYNKGSNLPDANITIMIDNIFKSMQHISKNPLCSDFFCELNNFLTEYVKPLPKESYLFKYLLSKLNYLRLECSCPIVKSNIIKCKEMLSGNSDTIKDARFSSPNIDNVKRSKKREAVIVNTVTENGVEYAVVKSNWKFNLKNLTENQKEKLQRKREDIPALYQDLSQSQDEFKLAKWKTDSQDTTSSNSKSSKLTTNKDASNILKNIQSSDVVPNIMQNILSENHAIGSSEIDVTCVMQTDSNESVKVRRPTPSTPKNVKSPRMALKDRVFRNVRNLIEKSSCKNDTTHTIGGECQQKITPTKKIIKNANLVNSAPPLILTDRPSRVKRVPKKFADVQLFGLKKRRYSQTDSQSHSENEYEIFNDLHQGEKDTAKAELSAVDNNAGNSRSIVENSGPLEVKQVESVQDNLQITDVLVSQTESIKGVSHNLTSEKSCSTGDKEHAQVVQINDNILNIDNNNDHNKHDKEDSKETIVSSEIQKNNDVQCVPIEDVGQDKQIDSSLNCQQNDVQDIQMEISQDQKNELDYMVANINVVKIDSKTDDKKIKTNYETDSKNKQIMTLKTPDRKTKEEPQKSTTKKSNTKKSRIEKELAIDMVEGHPFLKIQSEKRLTRKKLIETENVCKKNVLEKSTKKKAQSKTSPKEAKKAKNTEILSNAQELVTVTIEESQEKEPLPEDAPCSEDVIESSQDSNFTAVSVKSTKRTPKRQPVVSIKMLEITDAEITATQDLLQDSDCEMLTMTNKSSSQNDIELPQNKTAEVDKNQSELTENMDTEPIVSETMTDDVIIINDDRESSIIISSEKSIGLVTQELAEADTQPTDPADLAEYGLNETSPTHPEILSTPTDITESISSSKLAAISAPESQDVIEILSEPDCVEKDSDASSPYKDDAQRKQDFLNNTSEISPIKVQSPDKNKSSPEKNEETSSDYLVVKLSSPVQSNGEPYSSKGSPEFFTDDKISPDKRDQSPPRVEVASSTGSPSSSLSLKKNRTQSLRPGGRAAHMIGLCVPDVVYSKKNTDKADPEETKKPTSTPARRNLRVFYNAVSENSDISEDKEQDNFLKLKKALPSVDSSPAVPILKRKIDIVDDTSASPASKRKRVSFHDPPVSTTVSVQKYIKPDCIEPPSVAQRRLEVHLTRNMTKSPKRIENTLKLDTVLSKAIESFTEPTSDSLPNDTSSLDVTPAVEVVVTSELNDTDPICAELIDCKDPIETIAAELSSAAMKDLFIKELDGKVLSVGDLAKMTELEVNRLCIKAPKVQVAKKVLASYVNRRVVTTQEVTPEPMILTDATAIATELDEDMTESEAETINTAVETQTDDVTMCETASQTMTEISKFASTQTTSVSMVDIDTQTLESGYKTTTDIITSCLSEREDFVQKLGQLLPKDGIVDMVVNQAEDSTPKLVVTRLWDRLNQDLPSDERTSKEFSTIKDILLERYDSRNLILFCSSLLQRLYDKSA